MEIDPALADGDAFLFEQGLLAGQAVGVAVQGSVGADDAVAGDFGGVGVSRHGLTRGDGGTRRAGGAGEVAVGAHPAGRDLFAQGPAPLGERHALGDAAGEEVGFAPASGRGGNDGGGLCHTASVAGVAR